ncbi:S8 family serine peptidase [Streptosporangium sp. NPDC003464]
MMIGRALVAVSVLLTVGAAGVPAAGAAEPDKCAPGRGTTSIGESWAQRRFNLPEAWRLTRGAGVTVAVVDSGLDTGHPQLKQGTAEEVTGTGGRDCFGHGTEVAGIIAATPMKGVLFTGVAPDVKLISVKHTDDGRGDVKMLALAIVKAVQLGADVINVSAQASDNPDLRNATAYALAKNVVVVAAAGNVEKDDGSPAPAYPASYPGVVSVGSAAPDGSRADSSNPVTPITVLAPGTGLTSTWPGSLYQENLEGTSYAAAYVTGVVALVRSRYRDLTNEEVGRRIALTANGGAGKGTGAGMINPLLAISAILHSETVALAPPEPAPLPADAIRHATPENAESIAMATRIALISLAAVALVTLGSLTIPLGRSRRWRAGAPDNGT